MPRVVIVTDQGEEVGEVPTFLATPGRAARGPSHGWNGTIFEQLWAEAQRRENVAEMVAEANACKSVGSLSRGKS